MTDFHCLNSADDEQAGSGASTTEPVMFVQEIVDLGTSSVALVHLDTSAIGTDTITAATLHWYTDSTSLKSPKANTFLQTIHIGSTPMYSTTAAEPAGWASHALTSGELADINKTGDTTFLFGVGTLVTSGYSRSWRIRAWDYAPTGTYSVYLEVTHAAAGGPTKTTIIGV